MTDKEYRKKLLESGVSQWILDRTTSSHGLNCIGNIMDVYRTTMEEQNPARAQIMRFRGKVNAVGLRAAMLAEDKLSTQDIKKKRIYLP